MERFANNNENIEKIKQYQEKHLPSSLRSSKKINLVLSAGLEHFYAKEAEISGLENLPETGPFIVISNHFNVKETEILLATLKNYDTHIVAAEKIHGEHPVRKITLDFIRGITAPESLAHLSHEQKQALLEKVPEGFIKAVSTI